MTPICRLHLTIRPCSALFVSDSSWGSIGYREGHEAVPLLDGLAVHGGHSASPQNGDLNPPAAISVVSAALWRVRLSPLCATLEAATDTAANPSGFRQKVNSTVRVTRKFTHAIHFELLY